MQTWSLYMETDEMIERTFCDAAYEKEVHFIWVAWGEKHIREALAGARVCRAWNKYANPNVRYFVYILDDWHNIPRNLLKKQQKHGIEIIERPNALPDNPALFDLDRVKIMAEHDVPTMYIDTDLYVLCPLPLSSMGSGLKTFGMGLARVGFGCNQIHGMVDEVLDAESSIYYTDCGMERDVFEAPYQFWPWARINMGQIWSGRPDLVREFLANFEEINAAFAQTRYFGVGEMIFTAMHNAGMIRGHEFSWRNGWNKIWPFIDKVEAKIGVIEAKRPDIAHGIYPVSRHDILHVGHFGVQTHLGWTETQRPLLVAVLDDDSIELVTRYVNTNKAFPQALFPLLSD